MHQVLLRAALFCVFFSIVTAEVFAQNYTTIASGSWTSTSVWNNTSGWGGSTPPLSGQGFGTLSINHDVTVSGNYSTGATLNIAAGKTMTITGNLAITGGGTINVSGILLISGTTSLSGNLNILPGGVVYTIGTLTVNSTNYLTIGTNAAGPPYADLVAYGNVISNTSGDITINQNGRLGIFGNVSATGGGTLFQINNGGQVYVDGDITFTGGGSQIVNNNTTSPYGLYVDGTITNTCGGCGTTANNTDRATMESTNPTFTSWVNSVSSGPLPVTLLYFRGEQVGERVVFSWATATEKDAKVFVVQKSYDGLDFQSVDTVLAVGNSHQEQRYIAYDANPVIGRTYYRLLEVDLDGTMEFFHIIYLEFRSIPRVNIFPTVVDRDGLLTIQSNFPSDGRFSIAVIDNAGRIITEYISSESILKYRANLDPGMYMIRVQTSEGGFQERIVVR